MLAKTVVLISLLPLTYALCENQPEDCFKPHTGRRNIKGRDVTPYIFAPSISGSLYNRTGVEVSCNKDRSNNQVEGEFYNNDEQPF